MTETAVTDFTAADDGLHPPSDNFYETETFWFSFFVPDRALGAWLYASVRPNAGLTAGWAVDLGRLGRGTVGRAVLRELLPPQVTDGGGERPAGVPDRHGRRGARAGNVLRRHVRRPGPCAGRPRLRVPRAPRSPPGRRPAVPQGLALRPDGPGDRNRRARRGADRRGLLRDARPVLGPPDRAGVPAGGLHLGREPRPEPVDLHLTRRWRRGAGPLRLRAPGRCPRPDHRGYAHRPAGRGGRVGQRYRSDGRRRPRTDDDRARRSGQPADPARLHLAVHQHCVGLDRRGPGPARGDQDVWPLHEWRSARGARSA